MLSRRSGRLPQRSGPLILATNESIIRRALTLHFLHKSCLVTAVKTQIFCNNMAEVPASELYDLDWPMTCDEVPSIKSLTSCTFPLTYAVLNTPLKMTSTFVRGTLASEYLVPNTKRALDAEKPKTPWNRSKHYCAHAQCPPDPQMRMWRDPARMVIIT